jgi:hypothetical protein
MERETTSASEAPLELLNACDSHHKGLRHVELHQVRGRSGYVPLDGMRWRFKNDEGEPCTHEDRPTTPAREIALGIYGAAIEARKLPGGSSERFAIKFHNADQHGEVRSSTLTKFEVVLPDGIAAQPQTIAEAESLAHISMLAQMQTMIGDLHTRLESQSVKKDEAIDKITKSVSDGIEKLVGATVTSIVSVAHVLPLIVSARLDAAEHEAEAIRAIASAKDDGKATQWWSDRAKEVVDIVKSPPAIALAAQAFGMDPKQMLELFGSKPPADANTPPSIRALVQQLGVSLTPEQQAKLAAGMGQKLMKLRAVGTTDNDEAAAKICAEFFSSLTNADWKLLAEQLDEDQSKIVTDIADIARAHK